MSNTLLDLLEKGQSLEVTGVDGLEKQVKAFSTVVGGMEAYTVVELSEEVGCVVEAVTVLFDALMLANGNREGLLDDVSAPVSELPAALTARCIQLAREAHSA